MMRNIFAPQHIQSKKFDKGIKICEIFSAVKTPFSKQYKCVVDMLVNQLRKISSNDK